MARQVLSEEEVSLQLRELRDWTRSGSEIRKKVECADFVHAMGFVNSVALLAERINHHPDIDIRWNKVMLALSTHSAGGLTELDFRLAKMIDQL